MLDKDSTDLFSLLFTLKDLKKKIYFLISNKIKNNHFVKLNKNFTLKFWLVNSQNFYIIKLVILNGHSDQCFI